MILRIEGTPVEIEPWIVRARRAGHPVDLAPIGAGRVRLSVADRGAVHSRPVAVADPGLSGQRLPRWLPWVLLGGGTALTFGIVALAVMWVADHLAMVVGVLAVVVVVGWRVASWRRSR
ncbi:MAG: hypothetical protein JXA67_11135 [Micromonosporaceae bacterium]|nr:hypothetical protein [Micromonosporaceae bacterium]